MAEDQRALRLWRVRKQEDLGWRELGWTMTAEQAAAWAHRNHYIIEKLPDAAEVRDLDRRHSHSSPERH